jgi:hypothetical protein
MKKTLAFTIIGVLVVVIITVVVVFIMNNNSLNAKIDERDDTIAGLETDLSASRAEATDLNTQLTAAKAQVTTLQGNVATLEAEKTQLTADLAAANSQITSLQTTNAALTIELKTIKDPRFFNSVAELTDWLAQDDTDTRYADESAPRMCYILQVRALRDGYLLPADVDVGSTGNYWSNCTVIGDEIYWVYAWDDSVEFAENTSVMPSHPEPLH